MPENDLDINAEKESAESAPDAAEKDAESETERAGGGSSEETPEEPSGKDKKRFKEENRQLKEESRKLAAKSAELEGKLSKAEKELSETTDKYMRVCAEYDNFRKRSQKEREGIYADAYADALKEILPIFDNLERASQYTEPEKLTDGMNLIWKSAKDMLGKLGIDEFGAAGDKFDPLIHNAVMHVEDDEHGEDEIVDVFQKGYKKGDKVIRHAMVKVAN